MERLAKIVFGFVMLGICSTVYVTLTSLEAPAQNSVQSNADAERFQISAWSHAGNSGHPENIPHHGAYVIDTITGTVWSINGDGKPGKIGAVQ